MLSNAGWRRRQCNGEIMQPCRAAADYSRHDTLAASGGPRDGGFPTACSERDGVLIVRDIMASTYRLSSVAWTRKFYEHGSLAATAGVSAYGEMTANPRVADIG